MRIIEVVDYQDGWPAAFEREAASLFSALELSPIWIHHIGSTSVPGLAAKPVIDILIEVEDLQLLDVRSEIFVAMGYECYGEFGISGRRFYAKGGDDRSHHLHAFARGSDDIIRHIAFRDYLAAHPLVALEYATLKKAVALRCDNNNDRYCEGKNDFVKQHEALALVWHKDKN